MTTEPSITDRLEDALTTAIADEPADVLLLSGGVDSSALLAYAVARGLAPRLAITVSLDRAPDDPCPVHGADLAVPCNSDHAFAGDVAEMLGVARQPLRLTHDEALDVLIELCLALRSFDLGNLNNIALYAGAREAVRIGAKRVWTGDDADSLFGGYRYLADEQDWPGYLARRIPTILPPFTGIAGIIGVTPAYPWLHPSVLAIARSLHRDDVLQAIPASQRPLPPSFVDQLQTGPAMAETRQWGKIPVRNLAARHLPDGIVWRPKTDLQFGSGMCALEASLAATVTSDERNRIDATGIRFFNDAHRGLYLRFRRAGGTIQPPVAEQYGCASCGGGVNDGRKHCPTCGAWPADQR